MIIETINKPEDVKQLTVEELNTLASEIRDALMNRLSKRGGHFGPNFGMVEAIIAMHYVFDSPKDKMVYDVSHQSYTHKILTGRKDALLIKCFQGGFCVMKKLYLKLLFLEGVMLLGSFGLFQLFFQAINERSASQMQIVVCFLLGPGLALATNIVSIVVAFAKKLLSVKQRLLLVFALPTNYIAIILFGVEVALLLFAANDGLAAGDSFGGRFRHFYL